MKEGEDKEDALPAHKSHGLERDRQTTSAVRTKGYRAVGAEEMWLLLAGK